jgi:hypothetical protein
MMINLGKRITGMKLKARIKRTQFTRHDSELHPECDGPEHLVYETITDSTWKPMTIKYGYQIQVILDKQGWTKYWWITIEDAMQIIRGDKRK